MEDVPPLIQLRAANAHEFCPRLFWLEYVAGEFVHNEHTLEGKKVHKRVDKPGGSMDPPEGDDGPDWHTRSLWLSDDDLGVTGKIDLVDSDDDGSVYPVDTKKGSPPPGDDEIWPADSVQLTLQTLLLRSHGYSVEKMAVWYHGSRKRVYVDVDEARIEEAIRCVKAARQLLATSQPPPPLIDSPKCGGCSLNAICQPDEVNALGRDHLADEDEPIRRVFTPRDDRLPLYVHTAGTRVGRSRHELKVKPRRDSDEKPRKVGLGRLSQLNLMGAVQISTQALQTCLRNDIPVSFFSSGGWFYGRTVGLGSRQVHVRIAQFDTVDTERALAIARILIADKIANGRTLIRRNSGEDRGNLSRELNEMQRLRRRAEEADEPQTLLGLEGNAARHYWRAFDLLASRDDQRFAMDGRNRRPPEDPVNAMLSYGYSLLTKDCTLATSACGLDPHLGIFHTPHHGRPALALDLMEPFRPLIVDSAVLQMIRRGECKPKDFTSTGQAVAMKKGVRKTLIQAYERRMDALITHPVFGYRISYRRTLSVQARLMARVFTGELDEMPSFRTR